MQGKNILNNTCFVHFVFTDIDVQRNACGDFLFGNSRVRIARDLTKRTVVTNKTVQVALPYESGVSSLNVIYNRENKSFTNVPEKYQATKGHTLPAKPTPDFLNIVPVDSATTHNVVKEIKAGHFDLLATTTNKAKNIGHNQPDQALAKILESNTKLIRIWKTNDLYVYNPVTKLINKVSDNNIDRYSRFISPGEKYRLLPNPENWSYSPNNASNFYKKYLLKEDVENTFGDANRVQRSLPEVRKTQFLKRSKSFTSDSSFDKNSFYQRVTRGDVTLEVNKLFQHTIAPSAVKITSLFLRQTPVTFLTLDSRRKVNICYYEVPYSYVY